MPRGIDQPLDVPYAGRRADCRVLNVTVDTEVAILLREWAAGAKTHGVGQVIGRLAREERTRLEERAKMKALVQAALQEVG